MIPTSYAKPSSASLLTIPEWYHRFQQGQKAPLPLPVRQLSQKWHCRQEFLAAFLLWFCRTRRLEEIQFPFWTLEKSLKEFLAFLLEQGWRPEEVNLRRVAEAEV